MSNALINICIFSIVDWMDRRLMRTGRDRSMNLMHRAARSLSLCCRQELAVLVLILPRQMLSSYMTLIGTLRWICRLWWVMVVSLGFC